MRVIGARWIVLLVVAAGVAAASPEASGLEGRWKLGGDGGCYFDATDAGPDQCAPQAGRWKLGGDGSCYFDANDGGPDQCAPVTEIAADDVVSGDSAAREQAARPDRETAGIRQRSASASAG